MRKIWRTLTTAQIPCFVSLKGKGQSIKDLNFFNNSNKWIVITDNHSGLKEHQTAKNKQSRNPNNIALLAYTTSTGHPHERKTLKDGAISVISPGGTKIIIIIIIIIISCSWVENREQKEKEKTLKYAPLRLELKQQYPGYRINQVNIIIDVLGGYSKELYSSVRDLLGAERSRECLRRMQKSVLSSSLNIVRSFKVLS